MPNKFDPTVINNQVLALMKQHGSHWTRPWIEKTNGFAPMNAVTRRNYHGMNVFLLLAAGYSSPYWASFNQWNKLGAHIKAGSKSTWIIFWKTITVKDRKDDEKMTTVPLLRMFNVFNADQVEGWTAPAQPQQRLYDTEGSAIVQHVVTSCEIKLRHGGNRAYYSPMDDHIQMPEPVQFKNAVAYDGTLLHEIGHWTGHESRQLRDVPWAAFGSPEYAKEELVAELFSVYMTHLLGIEIEPRPDHAQYLNNWMTAIQEDEWTFYRAAKHAERAMRWINKRAHLEADFVEETQDEKEAVAA